MIFKQINVKSEKRNHFIDITDDIAKVVLSENIKNGIIKLFVPHTTAGVTINEGFDPAVTKDLDKILSSISPYSSSYLHSEGNSDSHMKASLIGNTQDVFIKNGSLLLGRWQRIYFCEFDGPRNRKLEIAIII